VSVVVLMRVYISVKFTKKHPSDLAFGSLDAYEVDGCEKWALYNILCKSSICGHSH
jgi:hypothetical protein